MTRLYQIQRAVERRCEEIASVHGAWPCGKGCADCCRSLAREPEVTREEWLRIERALSDLPGLKQRVHAGAGKLCPMLDEGTGACRIYEARPIACRTYGFYAERGAVLGCFRIEALAKESPEIVWGNQGAVQADLDAIGPAKRLSVWMKESQT